MYIGPYNVKKNINQNDHMFFEVSFTYIWRTKYIYVKVSYSTKNLISQVFQKIGLELSLKQLKTKVHL